MLVTVAPAQSGENGEINKGSTYFIGNGLKGRALH